MVVTIDIKITFNCMLLVHKTVRSPTHALFRQTSVEYTITSIYNITTVIYLFSLKADLLNHCSLPCNKFDRTA